MIINAMKKEVKESNRIKKNDEELFENVDR